MRIVKYAYMLTVMLTLLSFPVLAAEDAVETVSVHVMASAEQALPANIAKRMVKSVGTIGEQLLLGRKSTEVAANQAVYEKLIHEVFDRVLVGYVIHDVRISLVNQNADISLILQPWGETVQQAVLEIDYGGAAPEIQQLMLTDLGNIQETIDEVLVGLPVEAVDWAGGVSKNVIRERLSAQLPEFRSSLDIIPGVKTVVKLTLSPVSPIVQDVHVALRSHTIPNLLLEGIRPDLETSGKVLVGIPVAYIDRHRNYFTNRLSEITAHHALAKRYGLTFTPTITAAAESEIMLKAETSRYNVTLEGYLDMGRRQNDTSFKLHVGKNLDKKYEEFVDTTFIPGTVTWQFMPGVLYHYDYTTAGFKYDIREGNYILLFNQYLGNHLSARFERAPATGRDEFGIRYKLHEFVSAEYVFTNTEKWLRLVGHL